MIFYNADRDLWVNTNAIRDTIRNANEVERMNVWLQRDPVPRFEQWGWKHLEESEPKFAGEPLLGAKAKRVDESGESFSWFVGEDRWNDAIDTDEQDRRVAQAEEFRLEQEAAEAESEQLAAIQAAKNEAIAAIEQVKQASIEYGIPIILPDGSTLNGEDAAGETVRIHLSGPTDIYWSNISDRHAMGKAVPRFMTLDGRVEVPVKYLTSILEIVFEARGIADTNLQDALWAIELGHFETVKLMAADIIAAGEPTPQSLQADSDVAVQVEPEAEPEAEPEPEPEPEPDTLTQLQTAADAATAAASFVAGNRIGNGIWWNPITGATKYQISHRVNDGPWQPRIECGLNNWYLPDTIPDGEIDFAIVATTPSGEVWSQDIENVSAE